MTGTTFAALLGVALALAGCGSTAPYPTAPAKSVQRALEQSRAGGDGRVALGFCYNDQVNTPEELLVEARLACPKGEVTYLGSDVLWTSCSLFQPARATLLCAPTPAAPAQ